MMLRIVLVRTIKIKIKDDFMKHITIEQHISNDYIIFRDYFENKIIPLLKEYNPFIIEVQDKVISIYPNKIIAKYPNGEYGLKTNDTILSITDYREYFFDLLFPLEVFSSFQKMEP